MRGFVAVCRIVDSGLAVETQEWSPGENIGAHPFSWGEAWRD